MKITGKLGLRVFLKLYLFILEVGITKREEEREEEMTPAARLGGPFQAEARSQDPGVSGRSPRGQWQHSTWAIFSIFCCFLRHVRRGLNGTVQHPGL